MPKRTAEEKRLHLIQKIRKLEEKIMKLPDSDDEDKDKIEEGEVRENEHNEHLDHDENLYESFIEEKETEMNNEETPEEETLDEEILDILGVAPTPIPKKETLHKDIAERWTDILSKGLKKEEKESIKNDNPPFENVQKMVAPKLNKEVAAALNDNAKKRDILIENRQKQVSTALVCVGQAIQLSLRDIKEQRIKIIKKLNEAARLLCDSLFLDSKGRRSLVLSVINKDLKDFLLETEAAEFLFGDNLTEKIKTAKAVQRSGKDLKTPVTEDKKKTFVKRTEPTEKKSSLNWRGPPRQGTQQKLQRSGGQSLNRQQYNMKRTEDKTSKRGRR